MDYSASSKRALEWAIQNLFRRGDTVVVLHVQHPGAGGDEAKRAALWAKSGSRKHSLPITDPSIADRAPLLPCLACCVSKLTP
jgi:hypothetical protein